MTSTESVRLSDLIAPDFRDLHKILKASDDIEELWCKGGRGSTKSTFIAIQIILGLSKDHDAHAFVSRRYDNELRDTVYGQVQWAVNAMGVDHEWRFMSKPMQAVNLLTGQKIIFRGIDNPLKAKSINLGKGYIKYFWAEEVDQYGSMEELRSILQSIFRGKGNNRVAFFSYNPPKSMRAWVNQEVATDKPGRMVHTSDYRNVPPEWLGERFLTDAEHLKATNETAYEHEYLGVPVGTGLEVFNNVSLRAITDDEKLNFPTIYQGLDFGYAVDPLSFVRVYFNPGRRTLYIFEEIQGVGLSNRAFAAQASIDHRRTLTKADSEAPKDIDELRNEYGFIIQGAKKPPGSVEHGVKWLADLEEIVIDPNTCPLASREFINYALLTTRSGEVVSRYPDKDNHSIDAVRYALNDVIMSAPKKKQIDPGVMPIAHRW